MTTYTIKLTEEQYNRMYKDMKEEMENAKTMSEIPGQKWKEAWKSEYYLYRHILEQLTKAETTKIN